MRENLHGQPPVEVFLNAMTKDTMIRHSSCLLLQMYSKSVIKWHLLVKYKKKVFEEQEESYGK